ncbi:MAG TPA: hypothetical protein VM759_02075, partial [Longimicrobium sp.]|nr:hypothetical protein [Longimicrobium sp.]
MRNRWPARGVFALALLAGLGACTDSPVAPAAPTLESADEIEPRAGFSARDAFVTVSAGLGFSCGTTLDGAAYCWGDNSFGQLGTGGFDGQTLPAAVAGLAPAWSASAGAAHACALSRSGRVYCWGDNSLGQLGDGTFNGSGTPVAVQAAPSVVFAQVSAGAIHGCALALDGSAWCWGDNSLGQLGNGTTMGSAVPVRVQAPAGVRFVSVVTGDGAAHTCGLATSGAAYCWGDNTYGQLGTGSTASTTVPVLV